MKTQKITEKKYMKAQKIVKEYEKQEPKITHNPPPKPPLDRILREGISRFCTNCGSSISKDGFLGLFGEMLCHNQQCPNSESKKIYR